MLQLQYYNSKLTKSQIDGILNNFNIKYTTVKNEIDSKFNNLLKLFMDDILSFLENIEEISKERKKLKDFENFKREYDILSSKLKEKTLNEHKLENDIESLQKEILYLKNENKSHKKKISEKKISTTSKSKTTKNIFSNKKHIKLKSESINTTFDNINNTSNISNINNTYGNNIINTSKKINKAKTKIIIPNKNIEKTVKKQTKKENGQKDKKYFSPDLITLNKNKIIDNSNKIDKTIQKIKQYNMNRNNIRIKKIQNIKFAKYKNKFKTKIKTDNITGQKKNSRNYNTKGKEDNLEKKETFEPDKFLSLVESIPINDDINLNNYSEDDENQSKNNNSSSISEEVNSENIENVDNEIKELEEDENNILMIMKQIKELSLNPMAI